LRTREIEKGSFWEVGRKLEKLEKLAKRPRKHS
jgi:hypothetical protein